jgi:hypothetical protein
VRLGISKQLRGPTTLKPEQLEWFEALEVEAPTHKRLQQAV